MHAHTHTVTNRYSIGFELVSKLLEKDHVLNLPNTYGGLIFFPLMLILSECLSCFTHNVITDSKLHINTTSCMHVNRLTFLLCVA